MKVRDLMSADEIKYCTADAKLNIIARVMKENNIGALPVVDQSHKVTGIITDRDICLVLASKPTKTSSELAVRDALSHRSVHTVTVDEPLSVALSEMRKNRIGRLPVTDKSGTLKGMLSINNILSHALEHPKELGSLLVHEENPLRTIKTLFDRNNAHPEKWNSPLAEE